MAKKKAGKASKRVAKKKPAARKTATKKAPAKRVAKKAPAKRPQPKGDGPVLLSGGNPQIPKADGDAPVQAYIAAMPGWKHDVGRRIDELVEAAVPGVRKAVRWNTPFYGAPGAPGAGDPDNGWFLAFHCITKYVKVTFFSGASLDPPPPVGSKMPNVRYFHIHENEPIDEKQFTAWIRQAARLPGEQCF